MSGKHIVITGANSGMGKCMLNRLRDLGAVIVAADKDTSDIKESGSVFPVQMDLSCKEGVDYLFDQAISRMGSIDIFVANAGFPYYEMIRSADWDRAEKIFSINTLSPIYSYEKMIEHLDGRHGMVVVTDSAMGETAMPGFSLYISTKYALNGFRAGIKHECPSNADTVFSFPVSTDTGFFRHDSTNGMEKPFPVQTPDHVAKRMVSAMRKGKSRVYPSRLYSLARIVFRIIPPIEWAYCGYYRIKMKHHFSSRQ